MKVFAFISWKKQVKLLVFISWLVSFGNCIQFQYSLTLTGRINKYLLEITKRRSKVQELNMSFERGLNFDQWKKKSEIYKSMRVWLCFVYKFTENDCRLRLISEFIQTQKRYATFLDKIRILTWKLLVI